MVLSTRWQEDWGILSEKGHWLKAEEQLVSPGRGRLRPADRSPPQLSAAVGDGAATRRIGGSAEQRAGGGNLLRFLRHSCRRLSCAAPGAWHKAVQLKFASERHWGITEAFARN